MKKENLSKKEIKHLKNKTARLSVIEGSAATLSGSFGGSYITPFAVALNSSNTQIAFINSFSGLLGPISQWFSSRLIEKYSRKKIVLFGVLIEALLWLPIMALALLFYFGIWQGHLPLMLIVFFSLFTIFSAMSGPAWFSWMGDIIDEKKRGRYFSIRNRITSVISVIGTVTAGYFLDYFKAHEVLMLGFALFFFIAFLARAISRQLFYKHYEPKMKLDGKYYFSFWQFIKKINDKDNNFGRFALSHAFLGLAVCVAGPFFTVYMLKELGYSYLTFTFVTISTTIVSLFTLPLWGKFSDKYGNYTTIKIGAFFAALLPFGWLFSKNPIFIILVPQLLSGIGWTAYNLSVSNYIYDCVTPQRRGICVSYFNMLHGTGVFIGTAIGGLMLDFLEGNFVNAFLILFAISGILRLLVVILLIPRFKEVRVVKEFETDRAFKRLIHETKNLVEEPIHMLISLKKAKWKK